MDGVYFGQGVEVAETATSWDDLKRLNPYDSWTHAGKCWARGFIYKFKPPVDVTPVLTRYMPSGRIAAPL